VGSDRASGSRSASTVLKSCPRTWELPRLSIVSPLTRCGTTLGYSRARACEASMTGERALEAAGRPQTPRSAPWKSLPPREVGRRGLATSSCGLGASRTRAACPTVGRRSPRRSCPADEGWGTFGLESSASMASSRGFSSRSSSPIRSPTSRHGAPARRGRPRRALGLRSPGGTIAEALSPRPP